LSISKLAEVTVGAGGASSIDFTSIPGTYTDLMVVMSIRNNNTSAFTDIRFNGSTGSGIFIYGNGASATSLNVSANYVVATSAYTANTFGNATVYIPNYASTTTNKSFSIDAVSENNSTTAYQSLTAGIWSNTAAINQITLGAANGVAQYSSATLYGVLKGSSGGVTVS